MDTVTRKPRTKKPEHKHITCLKKAVSNALRLSWNYDQAKARFEKAKHKHEEQLKARKAGVEAAFQAIYQAVDDCKAAVATEPVQ